MTARYEVRDEVGETVALHCRDDQPDGDKRIWWELPDGSKGLPCSTNDLPLYGSHHNLKSTVVIVEGEKCAEALWRHGVPALGTYGAGTTPTKLGILSGRRVVLWPDNDDVGRSHMRRIQDRAQDVASSVYWLEPPESAPPGWDAADADSLDLIQALVGEAIEVGPMPVVKVADETPSPSVTKKPALFRTARELSRATPPTVRWVAEPWLASGSSTELAGKLKASGKTTWALALCRAVINGQDFMGKSTTRGSVIYMTEQADASFSIAIERAGLSDSPDLYFRSYHEVRGRPWDEVMDETVAFAHDIGAVLIVVDTLGQFAGMRGESENDAGAALAAMEPVQSATGNGLAVLLLRHERKGGGLVGESARGSSAFAGAVDVVLRLARPEGNHRPEVRRLDALSRFDETPDELIVELTADGTYLARGSASDLEMQEARTAIPAALAAGPLTEADLTEAVGLPRTTMRSAIADLLTEKKVHRTGAGKRGDPYRLSLTDHKVFVFGHEETEGVSSPALVSDETPATSGQRLFEAATEAFGDMLA